MRIRWFIVLLISALSACGENRKPRKARRAIKGRPVLKDPQDRRALLDRRARAEQLFVSWTASVAKSAQLHAKRMSASSALTRLIREAPSLSRLITAKLPFDLSGRAFQSGSSLHASRSDHAFVYGDRVDPF